MYHSHSGLQLDRGRYGPLIVEPKNETLSDDKEFVVTLDDWLDGIDGTPEDVMKRLKSGAGEMADVWRLDPGAFFRDFSSVATVRRDTPLRETGLSEGAGPAPAR